MCIVFVTDRCCIVSEMLIVQMTSHCGIDLSVLPYTPLTLPFELLTFDLNEFDMGEVPSYLDKHRTAYVSATEIGFAELDTTKIGVAQVSALQVSSLKFCFAQVCVTQIHVLQVFEISGSAKNLKDDILVGHLCAGSDCQSSGDD